MNRERLTTAAVAFTGVLVGAGIGAKEAIDRHERFNDELESISAIGGRVVDSRKSSLDAKKSLSIDRKKGSKKRETEPYTLAVPDRAARQEIVNQMDFEIPRAARHDEKPFASNQVITTYEGFSGKNLLPPLARLTELSSPPDQRQPQAESVQDKVETETKKNLVLLETGETRCQAEMGPDMLKLCESLKSLPLEFQAIQRGDKTAWLISTQGERFALAGIYSDGRYCLEGGRFDKHMVVNSSDFLDLVNFKLLNIWPLQQAYNKRIDELYARPAKQGFEINSVIEDDSVLDGLKEQILSQVKRCTQSFSMFYFETARGDKRSTGNQLYDQCFWK